ncbi:hypothetical protein HYT25_04915 [Candidatus Pacearchaeota archaeon]|nr:hypothetical protein [Candidatus Pacearchaeota archaeon]
MAKVEIAEDLKEKIFKKFKGESHEIFSLMYSLKENPKKGKPVGQVGGIVIKELKYRNFRFYFITDGYRLRVLSIEKLKDLLIKFVRMSDKKTQQKTIDEIKDVLRKFGDEGFS